MILSAYAQANDWQELHVWVGMLGTKTPPEPAFRIDHAPCTPRRGELQPLSTSPQDWSGRFVLSPPPRTEHLVEVLAGDQVASFVTRPLPLDLPDQLEGEFKILLCSCYSQPEDKAGLEEILVRRLQLKPDLTIMAGDQVYLDLPVALQERSAARLTADLRGKYVTNWSSSGTGAPGIVEVLQLAPVMTVPDDHEFWNNYPYAQAQIPNTWAQDDRAHWTRVAKDFFEGFQRCEATEKGATRLDVGPLRILCLDMRSDRDDEAGNLMPAAAHAAFQQWAADLRACPGSVGVLCSGQALLTKPANAMTFNVGDAEMPNYRQFAAIEETLDGLASAGVPVVYLTGDVHWGRVSVARHQERPLLYEVISSPSTLIHVPLADQWHDFKENVGELFGRTDPWPHHSRADEVPDRFGPQGRFSPRALKDSVVGNQVAMVGFRRKGTGVEFTVTYYGISSNPALIGPVTCGPYPLNRY